MDVILHTANDDRRTFQRLGNPAQIRVKSIASDLIAQPRAAFLGGEDKVDINRTQRLRHKRTRDRRLNLPTAIPKQSSIPKGLCPPAQGCEERATLGKRRWCEHNPEGVVANVVTTSHAKSN